MTGRSTRAAQALVWLVFGCGSQPVETRPPPPPVSAAPSAPVPAPAAPVFPPIERPSCRPASLEPAIAAPAPGPAYVLVEHVGVLRLDGGEPTTVWPLPKGTDANTIEMAVGPNGALWLSGWDGVVVLAPDGSVRRVREAKGGPRYEQLQVRADDDVWAVTSDIEWQVVHYDGKRWTPVRARKQFPGKYDDNKFASLAVNDEGVWVSSWNGLWRGQGGKWQQIDAPGGPGPGLMLWTYRGHLIVGAFDRRYVREGTGWRELAWPRTNSLTRAVGEVGLVAAPDTGHTKLMLAPVFAAGCTGVSEPVPGTWVTELTVDGSGRVWMATDVALAVIDGDGRKLAEWTLGALPGLAGSVEQIAVVGAGPSRLPAPRKPHTWEVVGRLTTYKGRGEPLANAAIELCPSPAHDDRCPPGPFTRTAKSAADGSFRLPEVAYGDFSIVVRPPAGLEDCDGPFTVNSHWLAPVTDCPADKPRCDMGTLINCRPFEMPPPLPH
ncbi:carboxypeptidase-like regulatory domain-containing protein [Nannocystis radixulma]|uniref:Carboxypeptidase-like regulatory domain-containing protein n=1 Tax=Nannocystis radixulma TaxID=2995305 RepID=A0ABT5B7I5_9BACT|nr:carboxypeptidase-like regulatory domain-containing protein [Nannocystis radixulma]MDC0669052.1 carboxypeptidase-like regulatory domain-containing protein [Nannocystis radixulma]